MTDSRSSNSLAIVQDPDCLRCMRKKLRALSVVVFFRDGGNWRLDSFEGDKPYEAAEVEFQHLLRSGVADTVAAKEKGLLLSNDADIAKAFPKAGKLLHGQSVVAARVQRGKSFGVRLAWRPQSEPFEAADLRTIECFGECPEGCAS